MKKMNWKWTLAFAALVGTAVLPDAPAWAAKPVKPPLPPPPPPAGVTYQIVWVDQVYGAWPEGMNSWGDVVGDSYPDGWEYGAQTAFLYTEDAGAVDLNTLVPPGTGMWLASGLDINDKGQIVGTAIVNGERHGYRYTPAYELSGVQYPAVVQDLGKLAPDDKGFTAYSINEAGEVCGAGTRADGTSYSYYYIDGQPVQPVLPGIDSGAHSINNLGLIGGLVDLTDDTVIAYRTFPDSPPDWSPEYFMPPGGGGLSFGDMNDNGCFVGSAYLVAGSNSMRAYRHDGTSFVDLGAGDGSLARGINNAGDVVGCLPRYSTGKNRLGPYRAPGFVYLEGKKTLYNLDTLVVGTPEDLAVWQHGQSAITPYRINSAGEIAGWLFNYALGYYPKPRGFLLKPIQN
jgi:probable HAF family extracellular repeat protein